MIDFHLLGRILLCPKGKLKDYCSYHNQNIRNENPTGETNILIIYHISTVVTLQ
jgi:hypothetical protein